MTGKTECCGWDVWGELAGIGQDRRRHAVAEQPVLPGNHVATITHDTNAATRTVAAHDARHGSYENR